MGQSLHELSRHALIEARLVTADRLTNEDGGREDFPGRSVVARIPAVYRSIEERLERGLEPVHEVLREIVVGRVTGVERRGDPAFGADEIREVLDPLRGKICRLGTGQFRALGLADQWRRLVADGRSATLTNASDANETRSFPCSSRAARQRGLIGFWLKQTPDT
jgi:hypothetical protein